MSCTRIRKSKNLSSIIWLYDLYFKQHFIFLWFVFYACHDYKYVLYYVASKYMLHNCTPLLFSCYKSKGTIRGCLPAFFTYWFYWQCTMNWHMPLCLQRYQIMINRLLSTVTIHGYVYLNKMRINPGSETSNDFRLRRSIIIKVDFLGTWWR